MSKKNLKRPLPESGGMDKFVVRSNSPRPIFIASPLETETAEVEPNPKRSKTRASGFNPEWMKDFPWVEESDNGMKCNLCIKYQRRPVKVAIGKATWVDVPCTTLTRGSLTKHERSECHREAMAFNSTRKADRGIREGLEVATSTTKMARVAAFRSLYFLAREELPHTSKYLPLLNLCKLQGVSVVNNLDKGGNDNGQSQRFVQEAMLTMGRTVQAPILDAIRKSPYYAILIDETTDVQVVKEMVVYVRYLKDNRSETNFLKMVPLQDGTASTITTAIFDFLAEKDLSPNQMCALGSDGASVMLGKNNGVAAKLKEQIPHLISNHCVAHRLALAVGQSTKHIKYLATFKAVLDQLFRFYRNSPVRMAALHDIQTMLNDPILKLQQAKDVRWLSHDNATRTLAKCLPSVLASLEREAQERGDSQAMGLSVFLQNPKFLASLQMMRDILPHLSALSKAMQARDAVYTTVGPLVNGTVAVLSALKLNPGENFNAAVNKMEQLKRDGFNVKPMSADEVTNFKETIHDQFIDNIVANLTSRFQDLPLIQRYNVFDATCLPDDDECLREYGNEEIKALASHFSLDEGRAIEEWTGVKATIKQTPTLERSRADSVMEYVTTLKESHPVLYKVAATGLLLPTSTADCERGFSTLKRVKTTHRNSLSNKVLNALLAISMDGPPIESFDFSSCVETWHSERARKSSLL